MTEHRSETSIRHVDVLSRMYIVILMKDGLIQSIKRTQNRYDKFWAIMKIMKKEEYEDFALPNGLLYRCNGLV